MKRLLLTAALALCSLDAGATSTVRAIVCDGCSKDTMAERAGEAVHEGTVYVFNHVGARVRKFEVAREILFVVPLTYTVEITPRRTDEALRAAFEDYVMDREDVEDQTVVELPGHFPIRSVAGALVDPAYSSTLIEDYLVQMDQFRRLEASTATLLTYLIRDSIPFVDIGGMLKKITINVTFPDGSSQDYEIYFSTDAISGEARLELEPHGNARMPNGQPVPESPYSFAGKTFWDRNGSLREWIQWASMNGLAVSGGLLGTKMRCSISGSEIRCTVSPR